ncbi:CPBP family intramembrane glutamic endopeptidase [Shewanella algae]|uniref:CPBP family intramembrane glutamic endopeptidase n=1 Tax=Shewanella algae TaxID=38313 RepID=UPI001AAD12BB|nr:CPBP family intramembrane metalloprotease [Shewanella algae]
MRILKVYIFYSIMFLSLLFIYRRTDLLDSNLLTIDQASHTFDLLTLFILVVLVFPLFEELIFRWGLFNWLLNRYGLLIASIVTSFLWVGLHFDDNFLNIFFLVLFSAILVMLRIYSGRLYHSFFIHSFNNFSFLALYLLEVI